VADALEFWPEYNSGPLWTGDGRSVDLDALPLPRDLRERLRRWNSRYDDSKLPYDENDVEWLYEGERLLAETRSALGSSYTVVVTEPWWGEEPGA
jgi:hypothetical protein